MRLEVREPGSRRDRPVPVVGRLDFPKPVGLPGLRAEGPLGAIAAALPQDRLARLAPARQLSSWCYCFLGPHPISFGAFISEQICFFLLDSVEAEAGTGDRWTAEDNTSFQGRKEPLQLKLSPSLEVVESTEHQLRVWDGGSPDRGETEEPRRPYYSHSR